MRPKECFITSFIVFQTFTLSSHAHLFNKQIYWSENGELVCISTEESFFILKFSQDVVDQAKENKESVTEDGIEDAFDVRNLYKMF